VTPQKRKVTLKKYSAKNKTCTNKPQLEDTFTDDDISLVYGAMEDASEDMLQRNGEKHEEIYVRIEGNLRK